MNFTYRVILIGVIPSFNETISDRVRSGLICSKVIEIESCPSKSVLNMVHNGALDTSLIRANVRVHHTPEFLLSSLVSDELWSIKLLLFIIHVVLLEFISRVASLESKALFWIIIVV